MKDALRQAGLVFCSTCGMTATQVDDERQEACPFCGAEWTWYWHISSKIDNVLAEPAVIKRNSE